MTKYDDVNYLNERMAPLIAEHKTRVRRNSIRMIIGAIIGLAFGYLVNSKIFTEFDIFAIVVAAAFGALNAWIYSALKSD